jgi:hypothetical protein
MRKLIPLFSFGTALILLTACSTGGSQKTEQDSAPVSIVADSATLVGYFLDLPMRGLQMYDRDQRLKALTSNSTVDENRGFLTVNISGGEYGDMLDITIQKIASDDAVVVLSSGISGGADFGSDEVEVFRRMNDKWQLDQAALADINVSKFYQNQELANMLTNFLSYNYELNPSLQELRVGVSLPDHEAPHMSGGDSATLALFKVYQSNEYTTLVMNWDSVGHKYFVKEKILNTEDSVEVWDSVEQRYFKSKRQP